MISVRCGVDMEEVSNVRNLLNISERARFRVFSEQEIGACERAPNSDQHFAGRFCAKEALFKALGRGWQGMGWTEAEVHVDESGAPRFVLHGSLKVKVHTLGVRSIGLGISHTRDLATASVILLCDPIKSMTQPDP
ncbi:MAG: holo-ACP synthase [Nitrospiraceae bacterium]